MVRDGRDGAAAVPDGGRVRGDLRGQLGGAGGPEDAQGNPGPSEALTIPRTADGRKAFPRPKHVRQPQDPQEMSIKELTKAVLRHERTIALHTKSLSFEVKR